MRVGRNGFGWLLVAACSLACSTAPPRGAPRSGSGAPALQPGSRQAPSSEIEERWQSVYEDVIGLPYRYGGTARKGFDCSGLVQYVYEKYDGRRLPRTTGDQFHCGHSVKRGSLRAGDLVFYHTHGQGPSHVGIYLWAGWFLHAANGEGVTLTRLDDPYYVACFLGARRL